MLASLHTRSRPLLLLALLAQGCTTVSQWSWYREASPAADAVLEASSEDSAPDAPAPDAPAPDAPDVGAPDAPPPLDARDAADVLLPDVSLDHVTTVDVLDVQRLDVPDAARDAADVFEASTLPDGAITCRVDTDCPTPIYCGCTCDVSAFLCVNSAPARCGALGCPMPLCLPSPVCACQSGVCVAAPPRDPGCDPANAGSCPTGQRCCPRGGPACDTCPANVCYVPDPRGNCPLVP